MKVAGTRNFYRGLSNYKIRVSIVRIYLFIISFCLLIPTAFCNSLYPFNSPQKEAQFNYLLKELRCLVCQNQDLADSNADLAKDLRKQVYDLVQEGKTDGEVIQYLITRYGDFILFNPPVKSITFLLWFGPSLFLLIGLFIFWRSFLRHAANE